METKFALPTLSIAEMSKNDQAALLVNQAVAAIVCAYLQHATEVFKVNSDSDFAIRPLAATVATPSELEALIDRVQRALKDF
jgi:hypothetical protein